MKPDPNACLITVIVPDRVGILRDVTGVVFHHGGNLTDLRQNIMGGQFALTCMAVFESARDWDAIERDLRHALAEEPAHVAVMPRPAETAASAIPGERYVAAVSGADSPGWVHRVASLFADFGVNIEDWRHDRSDPARTLTFGAVRVPPDCDVRALQAALCEEMERHDMTASLRHENIFRATNEVGPIAALFDGRL